MSFEFSGQQIVSLHEMEGDYADPGGGESDDDDLGSFFVDEAEDLGQGQIAKLVVSESEGSAKKSEGMKNPVLTDTQSTTLIVAVAMLASTSRSLFDRSVGRIVVEHLPSRRSEARRDR